MKKYLGILKNEFMSYLSYREHFITSIIGTFTFYIVLYFLWKAIFSGSSEIKGMTFEQTFVYLVMASSIFRCLSNGVEWGMYFEIIQGDIVIPMVRPIDYQNTVMARKAAQTIADFIFFVLPTYIVLLIVFPGEVSFGFNSLFFILCFISSFIFMFALEFFIGTISFYTESVWGISMIKDTAIAFLAGVTIPVQMFPEWLKNISEILPFKSIYQDPLAILLNNNLALEEALKTIGFQILWMAVMIAISRIFYKIMVNRLVVNGG